MAPISGSSPTTTGSNSLQDMTAAAAAIALDMKPKVDQLSSSTAIVPPVQKIKKLVRRNASDKLKLIQMVHDNPILWDSRLPNFKGAEEEKNRAWEYIGREFNAPGRRVARAFKSLRESYRRELAHVKLMGTGFKPKWSLYEAMDFLRDVIRERKGASHASDLNLSAFAQHLHNNNNNNNNNNNSIQGNGNKTGGLKLSSSFNDSSAVLNLSKCSGLNMSNEDYYSDYYVKPEMDLSTGSGLGGGGGGGGVNGGGGSAAGSSSSGSSSSTGVQPLPAHQQQQQQQQQQQPNDSRVSSTRNEHLHHHHRHHHQSYDDMDASSLRSADASDEVEELEAIDADFPYPLILDSNSPRSTNAGGDLGMQRKRRQDDLDDNDDDDDADVVPGGIDGDDYEDQMLQQHHHLRQQQHTAAAGGGGPGSVVGGLDIAPPQTVREILNSKFCGFISAKLNSMEDSEADNLMNRILLLLVQMQQCEGSAK
ncbi:uncharacterized protein Dwil_GK12966 [Drosophila willistoni]|uniref:MADF domain-containing protein n=1 Tax=Drosophila willistoni TaxID=7260 RepID=B4N3K9_DROWI|nr:uncharacterized protein Dwil_GK12966 [Drosophila willistoni]